MLVVEPKKNSRIVIRDTISGNVTVIRTFLRNERLNLGFDAPPTVKIERERTEKFRDVD